MLEVDFDQGDRFTAMLAADGARALAGATFSRANGNTVSYPTGDGEAGVFGDAAVRALGSVVRLRLEAGRIAQPSRAVTGLPRVEYDGAGLPTMMQFLAGERDGRLEAIEADLRRLVPTFRKVKTAPVKIERWRTEILRVDDQELRRKVRSKAPGFALLLEFDGPGWVPARQASEGTLLALGLLTVLHANPPRLVLMDDAERALHPGAQQALVGLLRAVLKGRPDLQIVLTTHSPDLVDVCQADEVRVMGVGPDGDTRVAALLAHRPSWGP
ncbi:MAG: ATP-binding protein [Myxococcales bacterium]|nr:ATP-binding protein [Myxococcales bacterium]